MDFVQQPLRQLQPLILHVRMTPLGAVIVHIGFQSAIALIKTLSPSWSPFARRAVACVSL